MDKIIDLNYSILLYVVSIIFFLNIESKFIYVYNIYYLYEDGSVNPTQGFTICKYTVQFIATKRRNKSYQSNPRIMPNKLTKAQEGIEFTLG